MFAKINIYVWSFFMRAVKSPDFVAMQITLVPKFAKWGGRGCFHFDSHSRA